MKRTAAYLGIPEEKLHINVSFTMLMVNVSDGDYSFTKFQRIEGHGVNMTAISEVSKLSWRAIENDYTLDQYEEELEKIRKKNVITPRGRWRLAPVLPVADSVFSSVVTGWHSCTHQLRPYWVCACVRYAMSLA